MADSDIIELTQLAYRYAEAVDACDADGVLEVFHPDARMRTFQADSETPFGEIVGHEQLASLPQTTRDMFGITFHEMSNHVVRVDGDSATGTIFCTARHRSTDPDDPNSFVNVIRYVDRYERRAGTWRIAEREIRFYWTERHPLADGVA